MERVKLIWEFRGPNAQKTAEHHVVHLKEFGITEGIETTLCEVETVSEMYSMAFWVVDKNWMNDLRERLKPHRGQLYNG